MKKQILIEKLLNKLLTERYLNLWNKHEMEPYIDDIWDILQRTYKDIGGLKTAKNKEDLLAKTDFIKLVRKNDKIVAASLYKDKNGRKAIAAGYDGSEIGKKAIMQIYIENIQQKRAWGEFSGKAEKVMLNKGGIPIPNKFAEEILGKKIHSKDPDGFHYTRKIMGELHKKIIIGHPDSMKNK